MSDDENDFAINIKQILLYARTICPKNFSSNLCETTLNRNFRETFGVTLDLACLLWMVFNVENEGPTGASRLHLLWMLLFLKTYGTVNDMAGRCGVDTKTFRLWVWKMIDRTKNLELIDFENRHVGTDANQRCKVTVDGTDFRIQEPSPFDPKWFSHKFKGPGLRYEVGISIKTGWIVWLNGPFPAGEWPDLNIARSGIHHYLDDHEMYIADGGYRDGYQYAETPTGLNDYEQKVYSLARARHETVNRRFKVFGCLSSVWRNSLEQHAQVFHAIAQIIQLSIQNNQPLFQVEYNENNF